MLNETEDKEEIEMLKEESASLKSAIPELEEQLKFLLIPKVFQHFNFFFIFCFI
jgi:peptide chain release factor 1